MNDQSTQHDQDHKFIACGMYSSNSDLQQAWQALFSSLAEILATGDNNDPQTLEVKFSHDNEIYQSKRLLLGHTCGYPYLKQWQASHRLVAVPGFDIDGCDGMLYSSWFISRASDQRTHLEDFKGATIAINGYQSNSGMNVLRHALKDFSMDGKFAKEVYVSGGHGLSMAAVVNGKADLAAIDAVTYYQLITAEPSLATYLSIIAQSIETTGLPFICHHDEDLKNSQLISAMNRCIDSLSDRHQSCLNLRKFSAVDLSDYALINTLEEDAIVSGYGTLQ